MSLILNGSTGVSDVDGSASTPAVRGTDTNTGIFFPAADTIAFAEGGAEVARFDSSGNLGIGITSPVGKVNIINDSGTDSNSTPSSWGMLVGRTSGNAESVGLRVKSGAGISGTGFPAQLISYGTNILEMFTAGSQPVVFGTGATERMRIDSSGNLLVGTATAPQTGSRFAVGSFSATGATRGVSYTDGTDIFFVRSSTTTTSNNAHYQFYNPNGVVGQINTSGSSTSYATSSDYRLKENISPMTGALAKVSLLKPCTYTWKADGSSSEGFIAHELQEVVPDAVSGEKDAVNEDGSIKPQGIDTSFLVATLTAAIQEQQAIITEQANAITALEARLTALEQA
jgi:hypothetical protein